MRAGLCTVVYLSRAFNPAPHPTDELEAARNGSRNAKLGFAAAALSYLCESYCFGKQSAGQNLFTTLFAEHAT